jgi:hypothetical protein
MTVAVAPRGLRGFRGTSSLRRGADGLLFHGRYQLIGPAVLIDQHSRRGFGISVQEFSFSGKGLVPLPS